MFAERELLILVLLLALFLAASLHWEALEYNGLINGILRSLRLKKWQEFERDNQTLSWLHCVLGQNKLHVNILFYEVFKKYELQVCSLWNFPNSWIKASTNLKLGNMLDHARSDIHWWQCQG